MDMKLAAAYAIANLVSDQELNFKYIIPNCLDPKVSLGVAFAVAEAAVKSGAARKENIDLVTIKRRTTRRIMG
jgi:malate dehydrogenase (oxaloacetate-decarboxylating)